MKLKRFNLSEQIAVFSEPVVVFSEPDMRFPNSVDLSSNSNHYEYQIRWVDSPLYYKRAKGSKIWSFCTDKEFAENVTPDNLIAWEKTFNN